MLNLSIVTDPSTINGDDLIKEANAIVKEVPLWTKGRDITRPGYKGQEIKVPNFYKDFDGEHWAARSNDFSSCSDSVKEALYDAFVKYLAGDLKDMKKTHTEYEGKYVDELFDYKITPCEIRGDKTNSLTYLIQSYYKLQFPLSKRMFYELVHVKMDPETRTGIVVQLPVSPKLFDTSKDAGFVVGGYTSVEKFWFSPDNKDLQWVVAMATDPGGYVPECITRMGLGPALTKDVPKFLNWLKITI